MNAAIRLHNVIETMTRAKVLVVGDVMLDMYEHCVVKRISPEAPVPIATVVSDSSFLGGAGNVANNARALGAMVSVVGVIGDDQEGAHIRNLFAANGITHRGLVIESGRMSTLKKRIVSGTQQLMRIDRENTNTITSATYNALCAVLDHEIAWCDVIVVSDYCKGCVTEDIIHFIKEKAGKYNKKIFVDSKDAYLRKYTDVYLIKPNKEEAENIAGERFEFGYANLEGIGKRLSQTFGSNVVITLGADGIALFEEGRFLHRKTRAQQVFDVSGAGDTVLSVMAVAVAAGTDLECAVELSNHAAGYVVSRLGTIVCDQKTLHECVNQVIHE